MHHGRSAFSRQMNLLLQFGVVGQMELVLVCSVNSDTGVTIKKFRLPVGTPYYAYLILLRYACLQTVLNKAVLGNLDLVWLTMFCQS